LLASVMCVRMKKPKVFVVLLNWKGREDTLACLDSLKLSDYPNLEIVVVDQGSQDGLVELLGRREPGVKLIANERNLGFTGGNNQGIDCALGSGADYIFLLNNDTVVDRQCISELVRVAEECTGVGALGPKIYHYHQPDLIWSAGGIVDFTENVGSMRGYGCIDKGQFDQLAEVDFISGCAVMVRKETIDTVGLLNEEFYPIYYEDTDWGMRIQAVGYTNVVVPSAKIWHKVSASMGGDYSPTSKYLMGHHAVVFMREYATWYQWTKWFVWAVLSLPFLYFLHAFRGEGRSVWAKALGIWHGFRGVPVTWDVFEREW
jgi:GT2 family glycosyltransferase